jgi:hypothetical protein
MARANTRSGGSRYKFKVSYPKLFIYISESADTSYPIIKRRIAWLIGKWVSEDCASPNSPRIWEVLIHLLKDRGPGTDSVVRLTAATALRECLDVCIPLRTCPGRPTDLKLLQRINFERECFAPFLPIAVTEMIRLLGEADTFESKHRIDHSLNVLIEQAGEQVAAHHISLTSR